MKTQLKLSAALLGAALIILATVFSASATTPLTRSETPLNLPAAQPELALATCSKMSGSEVIWVTLTEDGDIDEEVDAYGPDTTLITPVFEYNCVPKKTTLVTLFKLDGEEVFSDKESLKASNAKGVYGYPLGMEDDSALPEGAWEVEFYNNKTLLTSGEVIVGEDTGGDTPSEKVTVGGLVSDKKSKKPIKSATIIVLKPGVTVQNFIDGGQKDKDVLTAGQTDSKGEFVLEDQLLRNTDYSIIVVAKKYKATAVDGFAIGDDDPDPLVLNITMNK